MQATIERSTMDTAAVLYGEPAGGFVPVAVWRQAVMSAALARAVAAAEAAEAAGAVTVETGYPRRGVQS